jgi:hypothetical protein
MYKKNLRAVLDNELICCNATVFLFEDLIKS